MTKVTLNASPKFGHYKWQSIDGRASAYTAADLTAQKIFFVVLCGDAMSAFGEGRS